MTKKTNKAKNKGRGGIPVWLYITMSLLIPIYGIICYISLKEIDNSRAKIALFFAIIGIGIMILLKLLVWAN